MLSTNKQKTKPRRRRRKKKRQRNSKYLEPSWTWLVGYSSPTEEQQLPGPGWQSLFFLMLMHFCLARAQSTVSLCPANATLAVFWSCINQKLSLISVLKSFVSHTGNLLDSRSRVLSSACLLSCLKSQVVHVNKTELRTVSLPLHRAAFTGRQDFLTVWCWLDVKQAEDELLC